MADSGTKTLGSVLSGDLYRIPDYQRGYAWTKNEVNDFLDDLEYVTNNDSVDNHYINSIIVTESDEDDSGIVDIIDGQQRLITANLLAHEILRRAAEIADEGNGNVEHLEDEIDGKLYTDVYKETRRQTQRRVLPATEHQSIFRDLVPTELDSERKIDLIETGASTPSEQKLVGATNEINNRLDGLLSTQAEDTKQDKLIYLSRLATTLHAKFIATLHEVETPSEAGRMFEAINDRGRGLNRADKIKSYLVYRATLGSSETDVTEIHEVFTSIYETLNKFASDPAEVDELSDKLIAQHWTMFSGETKISNANDLIGRHTEASMDIDQIKYGKYHAPKERSDDEVDAWIDTYLSSLQRATNAYIEVRGVEQSDLFSRLESRLHDGVDTDTVRHSLYIIEEFGPSTTHALLIALHDRFIESEEFVTAVKSLEKLVVRMFGVGGARRDTKRTNFEALSRMLFWIARDDLTEVFPEKSSIPAKVSKNSENYEIDGTLQDAETVSKKFTEWGYDYSHEINDDGKEVDVFERRLAEDHLDGLAVAGWGGLWSNKLKNYILYQYENQIRDGGAELPGYFENDIYDFTIEHVWPQDRKEGIASGMDDGEYARYVERLGNLAFLSLSENASAGNEVYEEKWETYENAADGTKMVREEFPDPESERENDASDEGFETWGAGLIEWRGQQMARELAAYWACD